MGKTNGTIDLENRIEESRKYQATIVDYAHDIGDIWPEDAKKSAVYYWHYVMKHAARVCESIRRNQWHEAAESLGEVVVWWLGFIYKVTAYPHDKKDSGKVVPYIGISGDEIVWNKYPGFCPVCFGRKIAEDKDTRKLFEKAIEDHALEKTIIGNQGVQRIIAKMKDNPRCTCLGEKGPTEDRSGDFKKFVSANVSAYARDNRTEMPKNMHEFFDRLGKIYENNVEVLSIEEISFHLLEEVGEVSTALTELFTMELGEAGRNQSAAINERKKKVRVFSEELADVFSWSNSLALKINKHLSCASRLLDLFTKHASQGETIAHALETAFDTVLKKTQNPVDLIWELHRTTDRHTGKKYLGCEDCHEIVCDRAHESHKNERGFINRPLETEVEIGVLMEGSKIWSS